MNQHETAWLRKIIFLSIATLAAVSSVARVKPAFAQIVPANFDAVDTYISTKMKELGIPGAALVIEQGDETIRKSKILWITHNEPGNTLLDLKISTVGYTTWPDQGSPWAFFMLEETAYKVDVRSQETVCSFAKALGR